MAVWPSQVINYTNKTQFLFRIEKGVLDINDPGVNDFFPPDQMRVPFRNIVYIGDSDTDIPCMKLVNSYGGHAIGVYNPATKDKTKVYKMIRDNRVRYYAPADYSEGSEIDVLLKAIIDKTAAYEVLEEKHFGNVKETREAKNAQTAQNAVERVKEAEVQGLMPIKNAIDLAQMLADALHQFQESYNSNLYDAITSAFTQDAKSKDTEPESPFQEGDAKDGESQK